LFRFLHMLDVFEKNYLARMSTRFLQGHYSLADEKQISDLFVGDCSESFKNTVAQMFTDVEQSAQCSNQGKAL